MYFRENTLEKMVFFLNSKVMVSLRDVGHPVILIVYYISYFDMKYSARSYEVHLKYDLIF